MKSRAACLVLLLPLCLFPVGTYAADDTLTAAYGAVLRGDYDTAQATVDRILERGSDAAAAKIQKWLEEYRSVTARRTDLKQSTFEWNCEQARQALADGEGMLALSFTAQAAPYAADPNAFAASDLARDVTAKARAAATELEEQDHWTRALNYYLMLERIQPNNEELKAAGENATRHARLEIAYKDEKSLKERIRDVDRSLLQQSVKMIEHLYYKDPDFKDMAYGALDNLATLCHVKKMQGYMDGLANPATRDHFLKRLQELRVTVGNEKGYSYRDFLRLFDQVFNANRESVELPEGLLVVEYLEGAVGKLDDYSNMIWPADAVDFDKMMMGGFDGVGIQLGLDERTNRLKVVSPLERSPALEAGIQPDDLIVAVNGESTADWSTDDAVKNIMGPGGSEVILTIQRPRTGEVIPYKLARRKITITTVRGVDRQPGSAGEWNYIADKDTGIAYIHLTGFHPNSADELRTALRDAHKQGMKGLILDVRSNPGGLLDSAVDIVSLFVPDGDVVSTRGRQDAERRERVEGDALYKDLPLVVLVNEGSASASEILAGALQDHHRAIIVGNRTFGKGSVQHVQPLKETGSGSVARLKLTTALYYLPSGRSPHRSPKAEKWGVDADRELKLMPKEFRRILEHERDSNIIHNETPDNANKALTDEERTKLLDTLKTNEADKGEEPPLLSDGAIKKLEADPNEAPKDDPQLEAALLLLRVKLAANVPWPSERVAAGPEK
jgi:carboxyl-terminal processing protease